MYEASGRSREWSGEPTETRARVRWNSAIFSNRPLETERRYFVRNETYVDPCGMMGQVSAVEETARAPRAPRAAQTRACAHSPWTRRTRRLRRWPGNGSSDPRSARLRRLHFFHFILFYLSPFHFILLFSFFFPRVFSHTYQEERPHLKTVASHRRKGGERARRANAHPCISR